MINGCVQLRSGPHSGLLDSLRVPHQGTTELDTVVEEFGLMDLCDHVSVKTGASVFSNGDSRATCGPHAALQWPSLWAFEEISKKKLDHHNL